jgi:hypothetical protein
VKETHVLQETREAVVKETQVLQETRNERNQENRID